jgi:hypothetical protein
VADELPPDWAIERALSLGPTGTKLEDVKRHWPGHTAHIAFARYISEHEEPPVDPLLIEAREIVAKSDHDPWVPDSPWHDNQAALIRAGKNDKTLVVRAAYNGLKRGIELATEASNG